MYISVTVPRDAFSRELPVHLLRDLIEQKFYESYSLEALNEIRTLDGGVPSYVYGFLRHRVSDLIDKPNVLVLELFSTFDMPQVPTGSYNLRVLSCKQFLQMQDVCIDALSQLIQRAPIQRYDSG